ncbi:HAD family hydrolase [Streptomyces sp. NPDC057638]|uniref:HAD family hydrolase n=1 Tax=Streptomyces sp. NPDC057638 TaxID=3346190 RepID=UPI0036937D3F
MNSPAPPLAVLDMDGTLFPGVLGTDLLAHLARTGIADTHHADAALAALQRYHEGRDPLTPAASAVYAHYAAALKDRHPADVAGAAGEVWAAARERLFPFTRPLLSLLENAGFTCLLISGSPQEVVRLAAADLGIAHALGTIADTHADRYTGTLSTALGLPGGKSGALRALGVHPTARPNIAFAIGNSISDAEIFHQTAHPVAFEPDAELATLARRHGWATAHRHNLLETIDTTGLARHRAPHGQTPGDP